MRHTQPDDRIAAFLGTHRSKVKKQAVKAGQGAVQASFDQRILAVGLGQLHSRA